jgi:hypothetical protein
MSSASPPPAEDTPGANQPTPGTAPDTASGSASETGPGTAAGTTKTKGANGNGAGNGRSANGIRPNAWNLLLLIPLLMLVTPWFNHDGPRFIGIPFFYWFQFLFVPVGVICVWIVHVMTRTEPVRTDKPDLLAAQQLDAGQLDEGDVQ